MGNCFTRRREIIDLQNRMNILEYNNLGNENTINEYKSKNDQLQAEIHSLTKVNRELEERLSEQNQNIIFSTTSVSKALVPDTELEDARKKILGKLSRAYIDQEIEKIINNEKVNVGLIPDYFERKIYRNIFNILFTLLDNTISTTSINFLHHKIEFKFQADDEPHTLRHQVQTDDEPNNRQVQADDEADDTD